MEKPVIAGKSPQMENLEKGKKYAWCSCGKSTKQPFCNGSHAGSDFSPKVFSVDESKEYALCLCKHTQNAPFCDGSHLGIDE